MTNWKSALHGMLLSFCSNTLCLLASHLNGLILKYIQNSNFFYFYLWALALREDYKTRVFENGVLRRVSIGI